MYKKVRRRLVIILIVFFIVFLGCLWLAEMSHIEGMKTFTYEYGNEEGYYKYKITKIGDSAYVTGEGSGGAELNLNKKISVRLFDYIQRVIEENDVYSWDGFHERDDTIENGYRFDLKVEYNDGQTIKAQGHERYPPDYHEVHEKIEKFLKRI